MERDALPLAILVPRERYPTPGRQNCASVFSWHGLANGSSLFVYRFGVATSNSFSADFGEQLDPRLRHRLQPPHTFLGKGKAESLARLASSLWPLRVLSAGLTSGGASGAGDAGVWEFVEGIASSLHTCRVQTASAPETGLEAGRPAGAPLGTDLGAAPCLC